MSFDAKAGFVGLVTATSEAGGAPSGLRVADNVTLRREGALMPRPVSTSSALPRQYRAAFPYRGSMYYVAASNALYGPTHTQILYQGTTPSAVRDDVQAAKEARNNLYFASALGVFKLQSTSDTALWQAGLPSTTARFGYASVAATGSNDLLPANSQVGYRILLAQTDPNGVIVRSRPTGAVVVQSAGVAVSPTVTLYADAPPTGMGVTRKVELYRTRVFPIASAIDDELQLVATFELPATGVWSTSYQDKIPDIQRTTTLYTSPSRGGIENANDRPPGAACLERYRGSMFYGNTVGPHRVTFSYKASTANLAGTATGIGVRQTTATNAAGANTLTSVGSTAGIQVGMKVVTQASGLLGGAVTSIVGTTVTVSGSIPNAQTAQNVWFFDSMTVDGVASQLGIGPNSGVAGTGAYATTSAALQSSTLGSAYTAYELTPPVAGYDQTVVVERIARGGSPFQLRATHGGEMNPVVPLGDAATGTSSTNDVLPHGLAWSEPDEPEHVPPKNFARVGDAGKAILGLVATRDRLLIFKEDGLFMLTGNTARDFGIYPLDTTCLCILPGSIRRLKNTVFVLTNLGLCAVDENGGVTVISRPIQLEVAAIVNAIRASQKATGLYNMPGLLGVTGAGDDAQGEYHLALGSSTPSFGGQVLVYSIPRDGFTTFSFGTPAPVALSTDGEGQPLVLTASTLLTPSTALGAVTARVSPRGFTDPALLGKLWTHIAASFSKLTGTTSIQAKFTSSEPQLSSAEITETLEAPTLAGLVELPNGSLLRHPLPRALARAHMLFVELVIAVSNGTFTLEVIAAESRENASNKRPSHGSGAT